MAGAKTRLQRLVLRTGGVFPLRPLFRLYYRLAAGLFIRATRARFPAVSDIFVRRGQTEEGWVPGASDVDLGVIARLPSAAEDAAFVKAFWAHYARWKRLFPILGEAQIVAEDEASRLRGLAGVRFREYGRAARQTGWRARWDCLGEALFSCLHLLEQTYFEAASAPAGPDFGIKIAKGYLDVLRYGEGCVRADGTAVSRQRLASGLRGDGANAALERPFLMTRPQAAGLCALALRTLERSCALFVQDARERLEPGTAAPGSTSWELPAEDDPFMLWHGRLKVLDEPGYPKIHGIYYDSVFRWIVVADVNDDRSLLKLFSKLEAWPKENGVFRAPAWILPPAAFQALLWTPHLGTPFFHRCLSASLNQWGVAGRKRSRFPLDSWGQRAQWRMKAGDFLPPPPELLRYGAQSCAGSLALSLRLFGLEGWAGDNIYRLCLLYSRLLSLNLYFTTGQARDPDDLEALLAATATCCPELFARIKAPLLDALQSPPQDWNARPAAQCFYGHFPSYRLLMGEILAKLPGVTSS